MMYGADGKRAFVTGAGSGIGRAFCLALGRRGYRVAATDINAEGAEETVGLIEGRGGRASAATVDVTVPDELESAAERFFDEWGGIDLLINNAGIAAGGPFDGLTLDEWHRIVDINFWGVLHGCLVFAPRMREQGGGHIINVSSLGGLASLQLMAPYNATKAAVISLSETLKAELFPDNIGVTVVCPSFLKTNLMESYCGPNELRDPVNALMNSSRVSADQVAEIALKAMDKDRLYALPHLSGRLIWFVKRLIPERYFRYFLCGIFKDQSVEKLVRLNRLAGF